MTARATLISDMTHFLGALDPTGGAPAQARKLAEFLGSIVEELSAAPENEPVDTSTRCRRSECPGRISADRDDAGAIYWGCTACDSDGLIQNWKGTPWDRTGRPRRERPTPQASVARVSPPAGPNVYCERLGLDVPDLVEILERKRTKLFHAAIVALLENGAPMTLDELAGRLEEAGAEAPSGDMRLSTQKAWHGLAPIVRDRDGRFAIDLDSGEWEILPFQIGLKDYPKPAATPKVKLPEADDKSPLTKEELDAALKDASYAAASTLRRVAAVLDAHGLAMPFVELAAELIRLNWKLSEDDLKHLAKSDLVAVGDDQGLSLRLDSPSLVPMRRAMRERARPVMQRDAERTASAERWKVREAELKQEQEKAARESEKLRRAMLRVVPEPDDVRAAALLDLQTREFRTFVGEEVRELANALDGFDVIVGLDLRDTLQALGRDPARWKRVVDLRPPTKTRKLNSYGRKLTITPELLITGSTGISRPLGDPSKVAAYLAEGDHKKLARRLESDLKSLYAFYRYGVLHRGVTLRWGFVSDGYAVDWHLPHEEGLYSILKRAGEQGFAVEVVVGNAPGWENPWSRARKCRVQVGGLGRLDVVQEGNSGPIPLDDIQAVRVMEPS